MITNFLKSKKRLIFAALGLILLYAAAGALLLPAIIQPRLQAFLAETTGRPVRLGDVDINPFTLAVTLTDFSISERDTTPWIGFREFYVNYDITSLIRGEYRFDAIRLEDPVLALRILRDGTLSIQDLLDSLVTAPDDPADSGAPAPLVVADLLIRNGSVRFEDRSRPTPFEIRFDSLSLALHDFTTRPDESGRYAFGAYTLNEEYLSWRGWIGVRPFQSTGEIELRGLKARTLWEYLQDRVNYEVVDGTLDLRAAYDWQTSGDTMQVRITRGEAAARHLRVLDRRDETVLISIPAAEITGLSLAFPEQAVHITSLRGEAPELLFGIRADSSIDWVTAFATGTSYADSLDRAAPSRRPSGLPWDIRIDRWETSRTMLRIRDESVSPAAQLDFGPMDLTVTDLRYGRKGAARFTARTAMNGSGDIRARGTLSVDPFRISGDLAVRNIPLLPLAPYLRSAVNASLQSGEVSFSGRASLAAGSGPVQYGINGTCTVSTFRLTDNVLREDILRWNRLDLQGIEYRSARPALAIQEITAREPFLRFVIGPDNVTNLQRVMNTDSSAPTAQGPTSGPPSERLSTRIEKVTVVNGSMRFADLSMSPRFATGIEDLNGVIMDLSSDQLARADIDLKGKVDRYAPAVITGQINPLSERAFTDVLFRFQNLELTTFSTYFTRFVGYRIEKGKLSVDLRYRLNNRMLQGENKIVVDQLTLGEAVDGPDVTSIPVRLAIALLKDRNGVIDVDLPVEGSLDDPDFRFGPLIWKALTNLIVKLVTAPFALLGSLFGGGEDLQSISFQPGSDSLQSAEQSKLESIARALQERPALRLDVRGIAADPADRRAVAELRVNRRLGTKTRPTGEQKEEFERVRSMYMETFRAEPSILLPAPQEGEEPPPEIERRRMVTAAAYGRLVDSTRVPDDALTRLASRRAEGIRSFLVTRLGIDAGRVFLLDIDPRAAATNGEIRLPLTLNAM